MNNKLLKILALASLLISVIISGIYGHNINKNWDTTTIRKTYCLFIKKDKNIYKYSVHFSASTGSLFIDGYVPSPKHLLKDYDTTIITINDSTIIPKKEGESKMRLESQNYILKVKRLKNKSFKINLEEITTLNEMP
jgi:hypothetical protein